MAFLSVRDGDKVSLVPLAKDLIERGFKLAATRGTQQETLANRIGFLVSVRAFRDSGALRYCCL